MLQHLQRALPERLLLINFLNCITVHFLITPGEPLLDCNRVFIYCLDCSGCCFISVLPSLILCQSLCLRAQTAWGMFDRSFSWCSYISKDQMDTLIHTELLLEQCHWNQWDDCRDTAWCKGFVKSSYKEQPEEAAHSAHSQFYWSYSTQEVDYAFLSAI